MTEEQKLTIGLAVIIIVIGSMMLGLCLEGTLEDIRHLRIEASLEAKARCDSVGGYYSGDKCYINREEV